MTQELFYNLPHITALPEIVFKTVFLSPQFSLLLLHCPTSATLPFPDPDGTSFFLQPLTNGDSTHFWITQQ